MCNVYETVYTLDEITYSGKPWYSASWRVALLLLFGMESFVVERLRAQVFSVTTLLSVGYR